LAGGGGKLGAFRSRRGDRGRNITPVGRPGLDPRRCRKVRIADGAAVNLGPSGSRRAPMRWVPLKRQISAPEDLRRRSATRKKLLDAPVSAPTCQRVSILFGAVLGDNADSAGLKAGARSCPLKSSKSPKRQDDPTLSAGRVNRMLGTIQLYGGARNRESSAELCGGPRKYRDPSRQRARQLSVRMGSGPLAVLCFEVLGSGPVARIARQARHGSAPRCKPKLLSHGHANHRSASATFCAGTWPLARASGTSTDWNATRSAALAVLLRPKKKD